MSTTAQPRIIILAGGEGKRLAPLTRALYGRDVPKQFAVLAGEQSLLQQTLLRALRLTVAERIMVVVSDHHRSTAVDQLRRWPRIELVVQPRNLDTGPGILLPLVRVWAADPDAKVIVLPADHYFTNDRPLLRALRDSLAGVAEQLVALVGVLPEYDEREYGWIVRGAEAAGGGFGVDGFYEKPDAETARNLRAQGALWNTFISFGPVAAFWDLARTHLPDHAHELEHYARRIGSHDEQRVLEQTYATMQPANFSSELLANADNLAVVPVAGTGWSDWGSPRRVLESLVGTPHHMRLIERMCDPRRTLTALAG